MGDDAMMYLIGSLRNPEIPTISAKLRGVGFEVFDEWFAAGEKADDSWRDYEKGRGWSYEKAIKDSKAAQHVFEFDFKHLSTADGAIMVLPAGKSGHLELGWMLGHGKPGYILLDTPDRWDVMYLFGTLVTSSLDEIINDLKNRGLATPSQPLNHSLLPDKVAGAGEGDLLVGSVNPDNRAVDDERVDEVFNYWSKHKIFSWGEAYDGRQVGPKIS